MEKKFTYQHAQKLKSRKKLSLIFTEGKSFSQFPIKVFYLPIEKTNPLTKVDAALQVGVGVGGKIFKKAVERNRIKRLLREAYRLNQIPLAKQVALNENGLAVFFLYIGKELPSFLLLQEKMQKLIDKLISSID